MRYGNIRENKGTTTHQYRLDQSCFAMDDMTINGAATPNVAKYVRANPDDIEDIIVGSCQVLVLPSSKDAAGRLAQFALGDKNEEGDYDYENTIADEVDWEKIEDRYWLRMWWD